MHFTEVVEDQDDCRKIILPLSNELYILGPMKYIYILGVDTEIKKKRKK